MPKQKDGATQALDIAGAIIGAIHGAELQSSPRDRLRKFKIVHCHGLTKKRLVEMLREHFTKWIVEPINFQDLSGDIRHNNTRYFVTLSITVGHDTIVDGSIVCMEERVY